MASAARAIAIVTFAVGATVLGACGSPSKLSGADGGIAGAGGGSAGTDGGSAGADGGSVAGADGGSLAGADGGAAGADGRPVDASGGDVAPCSSGTFVMSGNATCADTYLAQSSAVLPGNGNTVGGGFCGDYLVWVQTAPLRLTCIYDTSLEMKLVSARLENDAGKFCMGATTTLPPECLNPNNYIAGARPGALCLYPFKMFGTATCAGSFDAQAMTSHPEAISLVTGVCGGYLVWLNSNMNYTLLCIYDQTTKEYVGARFEGDTGNSCLGAGTKLPPECSRPAGYRDGGAGN